MGVGKGEIEELAAGLLEVGFRFPGKAHHDIRPEAEPGNTLDGQLDKLDVVAH